MTKLPMTTRIGVRRIVIEVNRDLTVEQIEMLDETLKKLGLVKATKVTLARSERFTLTGCQPMASTPMTRHPISRMHRAPDPRLNPTKGLDVTQRKT